MVYARKDLGADIILDMATLTGAQGISTGKYHGGVLTNTEEWERLAVQAGKNSGDLVVRLSANHSCNRMSVQFCS